jgi:hypothetical protein
LKITNHKLCQFIIKKYIKEKVNWPREIKIAQKLTKIHKGYSYWDNLKELKLPSLAWFLTDEGKVFMATESIKQKMIIEKPIKYQLEENKIGEDKKVCQKPKSLLEFITYGKKT